MIRQATTDDLPAICQLEALSFGEDGWSEASFRFEIEENPVSRVLVTEQKGTVTGYGIVWILFEQAQIASIAIDPAMRRQGLGRVLLQAMIEQAQSEGCEFLSLEVRPSNTAALSMYRQAGMSDLHRVRKYYSDGEDALVLGLGI